MSEPVKQTEQITKEMSIDDLRKLLRAAERTIAMNSNVGFDTCFDRLIAHEGGYVNHPTDPGGETNWGISKRSYPQLDIKSLTREDARTIYRRDFWVPIAMDRLPSSVCFQLFDFAVNSGITNAIRVFQRSVGAADDGHWGPVSQKLADSLSENDLIMRFNAYRLKFYASLSTWPSFGKGWTKRVADNLLYAADDNAF